MTDSMTPTALSLTTDTGPITISLLGRALLTSADASAARDVLDVEQGVESVSKYLPLAGGNRSTAIQMAIDAAAAAPGGGRVVEDKGKFDVVGIVNKSKVTIEGKGPAKTIWRLPDGSPPGSRVIASEDFDLNHFSDDGTTKPWYGVAYAGIENLSIQGNKGNNPSGGEGIAHFGYGTRFFNISVRGTAGNGIVHEAPRSFQIENEADSAGFIFRGELVDVNNCGGDGFLYYGPTDSILTNSILWKNTGANLRVMGRGVALHLRGVHCYSGGGGPGVAASDYGLWANTTVHAIDCDFESSAIASVYLTGDASGDGVHPTTQSQFGATASTFLGCKVYSNQHAGSAGMILDGSIATLSTIRVDGGRFSSNLESFRVLGSVTNSHFATTISTAPGEIWGTIGGDVNGTFSATNTVLLLCTGGGTFYKGGPQFASTIGLRPWTALPLGGAFSPAVGLQAPQYRKNLLGAVELRGSAGNNSGADQPAGAVIANLPGGNRPAAIESWPVAPVIGLAVAPRVSVNPDGRILAESTIPASEAISLSGISFDPA